MKKNWVFLGGLLAAVLVSLCFFGVRLRIAPRWILSRSLESAIEQLESRFENSPAHLLSDVLDSQGRQQAQLKLETEGKHLGPVVYDMTLLTQLGPNRIQADGSVITGGKVLDISLFLDENFASVSSQGLLEGRYYGITYDTFSDNIRSRQILAALIGEKTISGWEDSVSDLDRAMSREVKLPEWELDEVVSALYGVLALKPQVTRIDTPAGAAPKTDAVIFRATGQEIAELAAPYRDQMTAELLAIIDQWRADVSASVEVTFFLHKGDLVEIHVLVKTATDSTLIFVTLGTNPGKGQLALVITTESATDRSDLSLRIETTSDEGTYREKLRFWQNKNREKTETSLEYAYDLSTGEMDLTILRDGDEARLRLNLAGEEDALTIRSQDVSPLINLFLEKAMESPVICTLTVSPGREVAVPEYRNLDQWSMEELLALLAGFGELLGLKLP